MKISCEIIRDLLPLYLDDVCSNDSKTMIEEHFAECDNCKSELQTMAQNLHIISKEQNLLEAEVVKKMSNKWRKGMMISFLKGALIMLLTVAIVLFIINLFVGIKIM